MFLNGSELALWQTLGFTLQLVGLNWTSAPRSAFLPYLNAPLVPILAWMLGERFIGLRTCGAASFAVFGTLLLTYDGGPPNFGDSLSVCAAFSSAMFIVRLSSHSALHGAAGLSAVTLSVTACLCWVLVVASVHWSPLGERNLRHDIADLFTFTSVEASWQGFQLLYLSLVPTALASWLQAWGQACVKPHEAVIIYTMDPVYGAFFAWLLLGEALHLQGYLGIALVLCANVLRQVPWEAWRATRDLVTPFVPRRFQWDKKADTKAAPLLPR